MLTGMSKIIHIRGVPDEVHDSLAAAAAAEGLSLTKFMLRELERLAARSRVAQHNVDVIRDTQAGVRGAAEREAILAVLQEGRGA